jgi:hypothetical protein
MPFSIIPERGQPPEYFPEPSIKQSCDVLHDDETGSYLTDQPLIFAPEPAALSRKTFSTACETNVLAGKSSANGIDFDSIIREASC